MAGFKELISGEQAILIDFHATWCGPCKMLAPTIVDVKKEMGERLRVVKIDIDKNRRLAEKLQVKGVPTLMLYKDGELLWRQAGLMSYQELMQKLSTELGVN